MTGFEFRETMSGSFHLLSAPEDERPMSFTIRARARSMLSFLRRPEVEIDGEVDAEGFADHRRLSGTLGLDVVRTGTLPYSFRFTTNDGKPCVFEGKKTLSARELAHSMTVLPGSLLDETGTEIGRALLRFDLRSDLMKFLSSFRLRSK
ncbi:MAG: hypothetical protein HUU21_18215 [Polyangiaceae bacterium]|nr:hypothetical protein [Polyangiaceae bacterium]NUQ75485.1 hypothetical protein [Polyangiaceae bacterium]